MLNTETLRGKISNLNNINASQISPRGPKGDTGATGPTGEAGADGISPTVSISKVGKVTTITITDVEGVHTATINDGNDGAGNGDMQKNVYDTNNNGIVDNAEKVNNHTVNADVPSNAVFTDTVYDDTQILGELGNKVNKETGKSLIEDAKITKLNGIEAGAQVNTITGVKGNSESSYRTGDVNITKNNIGLGNVDNKSSTRIKNEYSSEIAGIDEYDNTSTYDEGDYCIYNKKMYKCTTTISTAEDWTVAHWTETSIVEEIDNGGGGSHVLGDTLPIGIIMEYPGSNIPSGWLLCDGQAVSRTLYSELFNLLGTTYGSGDGSTTFNIPNLKGKVAVGKDENDTDFDTLGETGGEKTHTLTENEMPSHSHDLVYVKSNSTPLNNAGVSGFNSTNTGVGTKENAVENTGGGQAHNNLQPYIVQNFLIKAKQAPGTATLAEVLPVGSEIEFGGSVNDIPIGWEEVDDPNEYSTTETIVGTYNDKPLYRKILTGTKVSGTDLTLAVANNLKKIVDVSAQLMLNADFGYKMPFYESNDVFTRIELSNSNNYIKIKSGTSSYSNGTVEVTVLYTKTTD